MRWHAALFILRRVGILSVIFVFVFYWLCRLLGLLVTFCRLPQWGISEYFTVNQAQMLIDALHLI
jgi:hypothetical protein